jgi:spore germination protein GerM
MKRLIVLIAAMALAASACGDSTGSAGSITTRGDGVDIATTTTTTPSGSEVEATTTTTRPATAERFVEVYFLNDDVSVEAVTRAVPDTPAVAANTITALLAGPTPAESDEGLSTAIPAETLLLGITIDGGLATIDLSREFESGGGSASMFGRLAQVVYTLTEFPTVDEVNFRLDGQPVTVFSGEGILLEHPVGRDDYASAVEPQPVALAERHRPGRPSASGARDRGRRVERPIRRRGR